MNTGTVKFYSSTKSFGLFTPDQGGRYALAPLRSRKRTARPRVRHQRATGLNIWGALNALSLKQEVEHVASF